MRHLWRYVALYGVAVLAVLRCVTATHGICLPTPYGAEGEPVMYQAATQAICHKAFSSVRSGLRDYPSVPLHHVRATTGSNINFRTLILPSSPTAGQATTVRE